MIEDLKEIYTSLETLSRELDAQFAALSVEPNEFHTRLIELISKYPENKEVIQFIVSVNDRLVTANTISRDILYDATRGIISQKQFLIKNLIREYEKKDKATSAFAKFNIFIENNKLTIIVLGLILSISLIAVGLKYKPTETMEIIKAIGSK